MTFSKSSSCLFAGAAVGFFILVSALAEAAAVSSIGFFPPVMALAAAASPVPAAYPIPKPKRPKVLFWFRVGAIPFSKFFVGALTSAEVVSLGLFKLVTSLV